MIIAGKKHQAVNGEKLDVISPVTGKVIAQIERGDRADVDMAVRAARKALESEWGDFDAIQRGQLMLRFAQHIRANRTELAAIESMDTGKPRSTALADIDVLARYFEFYGGGADKVTGQVIPYLKDYSVQVVREPLGVTAHIIPWNYPAQMFGRSLAPALAMGNACVVKPAEDACLSIIRIAEMATEVGFPAGAINIVTGLGHEAGAALSNHSDINFISFTGSNEVGVQVQAAAAKHAVKCVLELGGKSAHVVFNDANIKRAIPTIARGIVHNAGQTCSAGSRVLVQADIFDSVTQALKAEFEKMVVGDPEMDLVCGPVINRSQYEKVKAYIERGLEEGLHIAAQGEIHAQASTAGFYIRPTLFTATNHDSTLLYEEIFGPVLVAVPFKDEAEAIRLANSTDYGLLSAVWTENGGRQQRVAKKIIAGQVYVNGFGAGGGVELPFGGLKRSGHGREKGFIALEEMSATKTIVIYHGED